MYAVQALTDPGVRDLFTNRRDEKVRFSDQPEDINRAWATCKENIAGVALLTKNVKQQLHQKMSYSPLNEAAVRGGSKNIYIDKRVL